MPLDSTDFVIETKPDLRKPSLEGLSWLLRHKLPIGHKWNFAFRFQRTECGTAGCALGVAQCVWGDCIPTGRAQFVADFFGMPLEEYEKIFYSGRSSHYQVPDHHVTPTMVADRIDEFLRSRNRDAYLAETRK